MTEIARYHIWKQGDGWWFESYDGADIGVADSFEGAISALNADQIAAAVESGWIKR